MMNDEDDVKAELQSAASNYPDPDADPSAKDAKPPVDMAALAALARKWLAEVEQAERAHGDFRTKGRKIVDLYTQQEKASQGDTTKRRFAMLWANVSVLQPSIYARTPEPVVQRRHNDRDPVARTLCEMQERALVTSFDENGFDDVMKAVRDDYLLPGRGSAWVRYEPTIEQQPDPETGEMVDVIADEQVVADFVHWEDFIVPKSRIWRELPWLGRRVYMTRPELKARFGDEIANRCELTHRPDGVKEDAAPEDVCKAEVIEIWSKLDKKCIWISPGCNVALDYDDPHLTLKDFFPAPKPALATTSTKSLIPTPDYVFYQDQAEEIDDLTDRIANLLDSLRLVGFYPSGPSTEGAEAIEIAMKAGQENVLVPVTNWSAFADKGGAAQIQWLPVEQVIKVVQGCFVARKELISDVYQITGISDIVRGDTNPHETKGAQQLKSQWGSIRLRDRQKELARFARDLARIMGEVIADKFQPDTLSRISNMQLPWQAELDAQYQQAMQAWQQQAVQMQLAAQSQMGQMSGAPGGGALGNQGGSQEQAPVGSPTPPPPGAAAVGAGLAAQRAQAPAGGSDAGAISGPPAPDGAPPPVTGSQPPLGGGAPAGPPGPPAGPQMPPQPQPPDPNTVTFDAVLKLMRDDRMRSFRVDIETDSTIEADENEHKQRLIEFMGAVSTFMQHALPAGQQHPELIPFLGESMSTLVRGFRVGRQLEGTIEEAMQSLGDRAKKAMSGGPQIPPDMQIKIEGEKAKVEAAKITAQAEATRAQADMQIAQLKVQSAQAEHQQGMQRLAMEQRVAELEAQRAQQKHDREMQLAGLQHAQEVNRMQLEAQQNALQSVLEPPVGPPAAPPTGDAPMALPQQPDQNAFI